MAIVNIDFSEAENLASNIQDTLRETGGKNAQVQVKSNIASAGRIDTGAMYNSINTDQLSESDVKVFSNKFYAIYQEKGIGPVYPVKAKALRFKPKGSSSFVFAARTKGFDGAHFFGDTVRDMTVDDFIP